jgi:hypothetical protein
VRFLIGEIAFWTGLISLSIMFLSVSVLFWNSRRELRRLQDQIEATRNWAYHGRFFICAQVSDHAQFVARQLRMRPGEWVYLYSPVQLRGVISPIVIIYDTAHRLDAWEAILEEIALHQTRPLLFHERATASVMNEGRLW